MKRTLFALAAACLIAFAFCFDALATTASKATGFAKACLADCKDFALKVLTGPAPLVQPIDVLPESRLLQASAFLGRLVKRDRPVVSPSWRMCPSI